jgi:hypothetical protein
VELALDARDIGERRINHGYRNGRM